MSGIKCCKDCTKRFPGCHGQCSQYKLEKEQYEEYKKRAKAQQTPLIYPSDYEMLACMHKRRKDYRRK